jgi:hypothetical protein
MQIRSGQKLAWENKVAKEFNAVGKRVAHRFSTATSCGAMR